MTSILAIGMLVAAVLLASAPIYARATSDLGVVFIVRDALRDDPGVRVELRETELSTESAVANLRFVEDRIDARLGWFRESQGRIVESANFRIHVDGTDLVDTTTRGRVFTLQGWEAHVQLIEGELPASVGADEPVQVALHQLGAQIAGLGVGDTFRLVEYFDTCQRVIALELDVAPPEVTCFAGATVSHSVPAVLTAIIAPIEEGDPFWYPSHKVFFVPAGAMIRQTGLVVQMFMPESRATLTTTNKYLRGLR